jgi:hypothetical protein
VIQDIADKIVVEGTIDPTEEVVKTGEMKGISNLVTNVMIKLEADSQSKTPNTAETTMTGVDTKGIEMKVEIMRITRSMKEEKAQLL